jgi:putative phosphoribosyl transferase
MLFKDRTDAGKKLADELLEYENIPDGLVIGLPRGGVVLAVEVAKRLKLPLDVVCPRKIGAPFNPEYAIGAITETGEGIFNEEAISYLDISEEHVKETVEREKQQAKRRLELFRKGRPPRDFQDKVVIIVDDGIATGSTMKAAIKSIQSEGAQKIVCAVPVSPPDTHSEISSMVDHMVCLHTPRSFQAVGQFFEDFRPTEDEDVADIMQSYQI